jgi:2-oxoglutarate dehydrogenase E2 component (dihydrolipoamide succinyltransferase)
MSSEVKVPTLGESVSEATVGQWLKQPGEAVKLDEPIASLETDKVAVEVPSPVAGVMGEQRVKEGDTVAVGAVIATIEDSGVVAGAEPVQPREEKAQPPASNTMPPKAAPAPSQSPRPAPAASTAPAAAFDAAALSPAVRRAVLEHGIDPATVKGTGRDGRLTKEDVLHAAEAKPKVAPSVAPAPAQPLAGAGSAAPGRREERVRMTRLRQTIARRLKSAQDTAALLTTFNDCDMSAVIAAREKYKETFEKKHGVKLGFMSFFAKAACLALKDIPSVNAQIDGEEIVYFDYVDLSVAVSAPNGLVVPVVRNVDKMGFAEIEKAIGDLGKRAKDGTLTMDDMAGGTFTISNGGIFGGLMSTPIINPPQSAVLGLHRIVDGKEAVTFLVRVKEGLEDPERMLLDL